MVRHYEAAQPGKRTDPWSKPGTDADVTMRGAQRDATPNAHANPRGS